MALTTPLIMDKIYMLTHSYSHAFYYFETSTAENCEALKLLRILTRNGLMVILMVVLITNLTKSNYIKHDNNMKGSS